MHRSVVFAVLVGCCLEMAWPGCAVGQPGPPPARESDSLAAGARDPYRPVRRLADAGFDAEARELLVSVAKSDPAAPIPPELRYLAGGGVPWWRGVRLWMLREGRPWAEAVLAAALLVGLVVLPLAMRFARPRLVIGEVDASGMENSPGAGFLALMQHELKQLTRGSAHRGAASRAVQLVKGPVEAISLPATIESSLPAGLSWLRAALALLPGIAQRPLFSASVSLHRAGEHGAGVTLLLTRESHMVASQTLWEREFRTAADGGAGETLDPRWLAEAAAVWLLFQVDANRRTLRRGDDLNLLGTRDWRSYALFRTGVRYEEVGRAHDARALYRRALERDSCNRAARVNLGSVLIDVGELRGAIEELEQVLGQCEGTRDPVLYSALYLLAVARYHAGDHEKALAPATELVDTITAELQAPSGKRDRDWDAYLRSIRPSSQILYIGVASGGAATADALERLLGEVDGESQRTDSAATHYNFACTYWILARHPCGSGPQRERCTRLALHHLARSFSLRPPLARRAGDDPVLAGLFADPRTGDAACGLVAQHLQAAAPRVRRTARAGRRGRRQPEGAAPSAGSEQDRHSRSAEAE